MAEVTAVDPEQRGRTVIEDTVVERIATYAAAEVPGVASTGSAVDNVIGRRLPKAHARVAGSRARVQLDIAILWPQPLATVAANVREHVSQRLHDLTGLSVDAVDVDVARITQADQAPTRRVQ